MSSLFQSVGLAFITSVFTLIGSIVLLNLSERFRRFTLWEPYSKNLWDQQVNLCSEIVSVAHKAFNDALFCFDVFNPDRNQQKKHATDLGNQLSKLGDLKAKRLTLTSANFNQAVEGFTQQMLVILGQFSEGKLNQNISSNLPQLWFQLVDEARSELGIDVLSSKTKDIMKKSIKTHIQTSTLPY